MMSRAGTFHQGLDGGVQLRPKDFHVGMIIQAALHQSDFKDCPNNEVDLNDGYSTFSTRFGGIYSKVRFMIVIALHVNHYIALPLFTHNGNGISKKSIEAATEFVSVHDKRNGRDFQPLSSHKSLVADLGDMVKGSQVIDKMSIVHVTHPVSRSYDLLITKAGKLNRSSTQQLQKLWGKYCMGSLQ